MRPELRRPARALVALAALVGCSTDPGPVGQATDPTVLVVTRGPLERHAVLTGELDAADAAELKVPRTDQWQLSIRWLAPEGSEVATGDRLCEFDNAAVVAALKDLEAAVVTADNALTTQRATAAVTLADRELAVEQQRVALAKAELDAAIPRDLLSARQAQDNQLALDRARTGLASARDELEAARAAAALDDRVALLELTKARGIYTRAQAQLEELVLRAPRAGTVVIADHPWFGRRLQVGDVVQPGFLAVEVSSSEHMQVIAQLSDVDDGLVRAGMPALCTLDAHPDRPLPCEVRSVSEVAQAPREGSLRRFFPVVVELSETDPAIMRPGMSAKVDVLARATPDALLAPRAGLSLGVEPATARLRDGGPRPVTLEFCTAQTCAVADGLREGDELRASEDPS